MSVMISPCGTHMKTQPVTIPYHLMIARSRNRSIPGERRPFLAMNPLIIHQFQTWVKRKLPQFSKVKGLERINGVQTITIVVAL